MKALRIFVSLILIATLLVVLGDTFGIIDAADNAIPTLGALSIAGAWAYAALRNIFSLKERYTPASMDMELVRAVYKHYSDIRDVFNRPAVSWEDLDDEERYCWEAAVEKAYMMSQPIPAEDGKSAEYRPRL